MPARKTDLQKLYDSKGYKNALGAYKLSTQEIEQFNLFLNNISFNTDKIGFICQCIKLQYYDWYSIWLQLKTYHNSELEYLQLYYGDEIGHQRYLSTNKRKTAHFDHSSATQKERAKKANEKRSELGNCHPGNIRYWIERYNMTEEEAKIQVTIRQQTFTKEKCIEKYGEIEGLKTWQARQDKWQKSLNNNPDNDDIGYRRSHSLQRYIERANGDEKEGLKLYLNYRKNLSGFQQASKESLKILLPLSLHLEQIGYNCYFGYGESREWFIYDKNNSRTYFYDFTIPKLNIIIEYNGETWHPNPEWSIETWNSWYHPHTKESADIRYTHDQQKVSVAENHGWKVISIFSSQPYTQSIEYCLESIRSTSNEDIKYPRYL